MSDRYKVDIFWSWHGLIFVSFPDIQARPEPVSSCTQRFFTDVLGDGKLGGSILIGYFVNLIKRLYQSDKFILIAGIACIGVNMFFAFPMRMVQTILMLICFLALCEKEITHGSR